MDPIGLLFLGLITVLLIAAIVVTKLKKSEDSEQS